MIYDNALLEKELAILRSQDRMAQILMEEDEENQDKDSEEKKSLFFTDQSKIDKILNKGYPMIISINTTKH